MSRVLAAIAMLSVSLLLACSPPPEARCGDGKVDAKESCDDGNTQSGDGCGANCTMELDWWCQGEPSACIKNKQSQGLSACVGASFDGVTDPGDYRCYTFRGVSGVSMGGGSASRIGTTYPELFDVVGVMGTPFSDNDFFMHMIRHTHMAGFCDREQILDHLGELDDPASGAFCGAVQLDALAAPGTQCQIFPSGYNSWFRGPDVGRGGGFTRNGLTEIFHDLNFAFGNVFYDNPQNPLLAPGVPESWHIPLGLDPAERNAQRADRCAHPVSVEGFYNLEYNPDGSYPVVTFCDGALGDTGDYWPDHHTVLSGPPGQPDGRFESASLSPGESYTLDFDERGSYQFHCAEHPHGEPVTAIRVRGEACDDGNTANGDGCSSICLIEPGYRCNGTSCTSSCGDGVIDPSEQCDDNNNTAADGCSAHCLVETGYACDGAPSTCQATCGDGDLQAGEQCDDGNTAAGDGCSPSCRIEQGFRCDAGGTCAPLCGDGIMDAGETCDDGNRADGDGCSASCQIEPGYSCDGNPSTCAQRCGDGNVDPGEACDDGNTIDGDGCTALCSLEPGFTCAGTPSACATSRCGNGAVNPGERCDDGNLDAGDGCSPWCVVEDGFACAGNPSTCTPSCGDGSLDPEAASYCGGNGLCVVRLSHLRGFGQPITLRPQQRVRFDILTTHDIPIEYAVAVDYNRNGRRDYAEPIVDNSEERYRDVGVDGCASNDEDGQGGCGGGAYDASTNPDPNGDDYDYMNNPQGTEGDIRYNLGEPFDDDGLDGVPATADSGEGDGVFSQTPALARLLHQSPRRRLAKMSQAEFDRLDWWLDAGLRDFINSAQITNQLWGLLRDRAPSSTVYDSEPSMPGYSANNSFWYLGVDYRPETIGKNTYLRYGDPSVCPGVDEVFGSGNHVGPGDQVLQRLYTMLTFASHRLPEGDYSYITTDIASLNGPTGQLRDFTRLERFYSESIQRDLDYGLVLPPNYYLDPEARFPVVYFMHGQGMDAEGLVISGIVFFTNQKESFLESRRTQGLSDWQKMILIFADGECAPDECYTGNFYTNFQGMPENRQFEDAFIELMRHVDENYRTKRPKMIKVK